MNIPFAGELAALITACLWSGSSMAFAAATKRAGSFHVNVARLILAAAYLTVLVLLAGYNVRLSATQYLYLAISGFVGLTLGDTFLFKAFKDIGARISMLVMSTAPAIAAVLAYVILGETISLVGILGICITIAGIAFVVLDRGKDGSAAVHVTTSGLLFAFLGAMGQGSGLVFAKMAFAGGEINGFVATMLRIYASMITLFPFALATGRFMDPIRLFRSNRTGFFYTVIGSIFGPFLGITFSLLAIAHTDVGVAATIMATVPILMLPLVRYIYKEKLTWRAILGAFVAVGGVAVLFLR
jgi:drug/metabolite transporter (DMT)-like permease